MSIGDYYARIEERKRAAWERVEQVQALIDDGMLAEARMVLIRHLGGNHVFHLESGGDLDTACRRGLRKLRELAHEAGNTGD